MGVYPDGHIVVPCIILWRLVLREHNKTYGGVETPESNCIILVPGTGYKWGREKKDDLQRGAGGYPVKMWVNVTRRETPQTVTFDACSVTACRDLSAQRQLSHKEKYLCPELGMNKRSPCGGWNNVWWTTAYQGWTCIPFDTMQSRTLEAVSYTHLTLPT